MIVQVKSLEFETRNPFELSDNTSNNTTKKEDTKDFSRRNEDENQELEQQQQNNSTTDEKEKDETSTGSKFITNTLKYGISKVSSETTYFGDDYHHIAPINTIDKIEFASIKKKVETINPLLKSVDDDCFGRSLCDISNYFWQMIHDDEPRFLLWHNNGRHDSFNNLYCGEGQDLWVCGIIDFKVLNKMFPNWQDELTIFQIPVLVDVTFLAVHKYLVPIDEYFNQFHSIFNYS